MSESIGGISMEEIIAAARNGLDGDDESASAPKNIDVFSNSPASAAPNTQSAVYCQNCGAEIAPDEKFCSICGCPVASAGTGYNDPGYNDPGYADPGYVDPGYNDPNVSAADVCPSCGSPVMPGEAFCQVCGCALGAGMPAQNPYDVIYCQNCGAEIGAGESFCQACGCPVDGAYAADPTIPAGGDICPNCGQPVAPGSMFCENCGFAFNAAPQYADPAFSGSPNVVVCPDCGRVFADGQQFCEGCGRSRDSIIF